MPAPRVRADVDDLVETGPLEELGELLGRERPVSDGVQRHGGERTQRLVPSVDAVLQRRLRRPFSPSCISTSTWWIGRMPGISQAALVTRLRRQPRLWIIFGVLYIFVALAMASLEDDLVFAAVSGLVVTGGGCAFFLHLLRVQSENNSRAMYQEGTALRSAFLADSFVTENALWTTRWRYEAVDGVEEFGQFVLIRL